MSASASPGRTWSILVAERRVPLLAGAPAAAFLHGGRGVARLSGLGGASSSAFLANVGRQGDSRCQLDAELSGHRGLGRVSDSVSVRNTLVEEE